MYKLFSINEANSLIPKVDKATSELQSAAADLRDITRQLRAVKPYSVEARNLYFESTYLVQQVHSLKAELAGMGLQIVDAETGKLGFPGQIGAELVYLTWDPGEQQVSHFRRLAGSSTELVPLSTVKQPDHGSAAA